MTYSAGKNKSGLIHTYSRNRSLEKVKCSYIEVEYIVVPILVEDHVAVSPTSPRSTVGGRVFRNMRTEYKVPGGTAL